VLTEEHLFMLITVRRQGSSKADAERFLESFHLVKPRSATNASEASATPQATNPLVTKMSGPMLTVARVITDEQLHTRIDETVQSAPPGELLGAQWNPSNAD
jgi:hypothetical protein